MTAEPRLPFPDNWRAKAASATDRELAAWIAKGERALPDLRDIADGGGGARGMAITVLDILNAEQAKRTTTEATAIAAGECPACEFPLQIAFFSAYCPECGTQWGDRR